MSSQDSSGITRRHRCLILGGRGFIGSRLTDALLKEGYFVRCFDRPRVTPLGDSHLTHPKFELLEGDFTSESDISNALEGMEVCFHLICTTLPKSSNADPIFDVESNVIGTIRLLSKAVKAGLKKIVFVSSGGTVYGVPRATPISENHPTDPICSYGISKLTIEKYIQLFRSLYSIDGAILRIANPYGEGQRTRSSQGAIAVFLGKAIRGEAIEIWGDGSVVRDYIHIDDVVSALVLAMNYRGGENIFNIGSGVGLSVNEVLNFIESVVGRRVDRKYLPARGFDVPVNQLCIDRARAALGWEPSISIDQGIRRFAEWVKFHDESTLEE